MSARAKKKNVFGVPKALRARQTTPATGGVAKHTERGGAAGLTLGNYQGYRIWRDAAGEFHFSGDPDSAFGSFRGVKAHIDWLKKGRTNPAPQTAVVESEIPVFRSGPAGFPGVEYLVSYPELNQAVAYAQAVKGVYPGVGVVCLEESEKKLPGGDYAVVQDAAAVRAVEAGQVQKQNPSAAYHRGYEDGRGYVGAKKVDNPMLIKMAKQRGFTSRQDVADYARGFQSAIAARRQNPEGAAAEMYEAFHGRPSDRVLEVTEEIHEHEWLAELGALVSFEIETPTGLGAELGFESDAPKLATNEEGTQLFVVGGNQTIDLKPLKLDGSDWRKESTVLGWIWKLTYQTQKSFDKFETVDYYHKLSEEERGSLEKRRKTLPSLRYDTVNDKLHIDGGKYRIKVPMVGVSPGIEN